MGFDIGEAVNKIADCVVNSSRAKTIASSPIYTSLLLALCIFLILIFVFRDVETDETVLTLSLRGSFYAFIILLGVMFLHNRILLGESMKEDVGTRVEEVFRDSGRGSGVVMGEGEDVAFADADIVPIKLLSQQLSLD